MSGLLRSLGERESTTVTFMHTYGAITPGGATGGDDDCPWDLSGDGLVNGTDLIVLLGSWGEGAQRRDDC